MRVKLWASLLVLTVAALFVAGCGASKTATQNTAAKKVVIAYTPWPGYGPLFVAQEKGFFKKHGVDVELQSIEGVGDRKQAFVANRIQGMATAVDVAVTAAGEGVPLQMVWAFDSSNGADGLIVKKDAGINSVADLKGKEIAFHSGSTSHLFLATILQKAGLSDKDIKPVDMKASEAASALMAGKVPAAVTWEPYLSKAAAAGDKVLATSKDTPDLIADILIFRQDTVKNDPQVVQGVVAALAEATDYMAKNPDESNKIIGTALKEKPEDVATDMKTIKMYDLAGNQAFFGTADKPGLLYAISKQVGEFFANLKILPQAPDVSKFIDSTFINKVK